MMKEIEKEPRLCIKTNLKVEYKLGVDQKHLWFFNTLVTLRSSCLDNQGHISALEHQAFYGDSAPLHTHQNEDEFFYILEGRFLFKVGKEEFYLDSGQSLLAPKGVPHQYLVESPNGGKWLTITTLGDFERFVCEVSRPAQQLTLPDPIIPSKEDIENITQIALKYGIDIIGPPLHTS